MELVRHRRMGIMAGLSLGLVLSGAGPLTGVRDVEAGNRGGKDGKRGTVVAQAIQEFSNPATVSLGSGSTTTIAVNGFETPITDVNITLRNVTQPDTTDLDVLLVGPGGQTAVVFSDVGFNSSANNLTVTLDDQAPAQLPAAGAIPNGVFQPTNFQSGDSWASPPAPTSTPASGSELGVFNGADANGTWRLVFQNDDAGGTAGTMIGGWSLEITSANGAPRAEPDSLQAQAGKQVGGPNVLANDTDPDGEPLTAVLAGKPTKGTVRLQPDGSFTYKAKKTAKGADSFTYLAQDADGLSDLETVSIRIKKARKR